MCLNSLYNLVRRTIDGTDGIDGICIKNKTVGTDESPRSVVLKAVSFFHHFLLLDLSNKPEQNLKELEITNKCCAQVNFINDLLIKKPITNCNLDVN